MGNDVEVWAMNIKSKKKKQGKYNLCGVGAITIISQRSFHSYSSEVYTLGTCLFIYYVRLKLLEVRKIHANSMNNFVVFKMNEPKFEMLLA